MNKLKNIIKKIIPNSIWEFIRRLYFCLIEFIDNTGPYLRSMKYCGIKLYYNKGNGLIKRLKKEEIFEKEMSEAIVSELIKIENPVFIDIGANIGLISLYVNSKIPAVKIYDFEPGLNQRELLNMTVKNNLIKNINVYDAALGDMVGKVTFHIHNAKDAALDGLKDTKRRGNTKAVEVPMITLDSWWISENKIKVSIIKIDTEGAELLILRGAENCIKENKPVIFLEIEPMNLKAYSYNESDIFGYLKNINYTLKALNKDTYIARSN